MSKNNSIRSSYKINRSFSKSFYIDYQSFLDMMYRIKDGEEKPEYIVVNGAMIMQPVFMVGISAKDNSTSISISDGWGHDVQLIADLYADVYINKTKDHNDKPYLNIQICNVPRLV